MAGEIDEALELLEGSGPEYTDGLSNHGPMAAEALVALGRPEAVMPWVEEYREKLHDRPPSTNPIAPDDWQESLGDGRKLGEWRAFFERELSDTPWRQVLDTWVARLAPGLIAAATHGVIRTGHAVRTLAASDTPERRVELAAGLGYWAARYQRLPEGAAGAAASGTLPSQAISNIDMVPKSQRKRGGLISHGVQAVAGLPGFPGVINLVETSGDASLFISDLTETFANVYLANAHDVMSTIVFIHTVTGPSAVRLIAPHVCQETAALALRYGWQAAAALYAGFGETAAAAVIAETDTSIDDLIDSAVATGDEHAIKFTETCLREHTLNPKPVYLAAARDATARLRPN